MAAANEHGAENGRPEESIAIDRARLDAARRRGKLHVPAAGEPWTACAAPKNLLVVDRDGSLRPCEYGHGALRPGPGGGWVDAWLGDAFTHLRGELSAGRLPVHPCRGCAHWLNDDLLAQAPPLRDYGALGAVDRDAPGTLVLRLPAGDGELPPEWLTEVKALLPRLERIVFDAADPVQGTRLAPLLAALRAAERRPALVLRIENPGDAPAVRAAFDGLVTAEVELLVRDKTAPFAAAKAVAAALGAPLRARFVFTPERWFEFEDAARAAATHGVPIDLRVHERDGSMPLDALTVEDLRCVKNVIVSAWSRCGDSKRPASIAEHAFDQLCAELRALLRRGAEDALRGAAASPSANAPLRLPPLEHAWCADPELRGWWLKNLFGHGDLAALRSWLSEVLKGSAGEGALQKSAWLRALCHRLAWNHQEQELLALLRAAYTDPKARTRLAEADAAFAREFELHRYGGPWAERLGLAAAPPRKRPFAVGKPRLPKAKAPAPDVTVLIPSYRHADYIEETLRSVLAQRYANFRVLVVDDCSPDDTVARARSIADPRLSVHVNKTNLGLGNSVLSALARVDTPYVALLNSDDLFHPDRLARCRDVLLADPAVQLVTTGISLVDTHGGELTPANASLVLDGKLIFDWVHWFAQATPPADLPQDAVFATLLERNFLATSSNLVARTDWLRAQGKALKSLKYCLDWQLFLEAALENALHHVHEPLVAYRLHATNTVWFREGRRWSYYLEVNRVAAEALRRFAKQGNDRGEAEVARVLEAMAAHVAKNRETDGFALFLNTAFDALQVDRLAASSPRVQGLVQQLNTIAEQVRSARDLAETSNGGPASPHDGYRRVLGDLAAEQATIERDSRRWLQGYADSLEARVHECWAGRERIQQTNEELRTKETELERRGGELTAELRRVTDQRNALQQSERDLRAAAAAQEVRSKDLVRDLDGVRADLASARGAAAAIQDLRELVTKDLAAVRAERDALRQQRDRLEAQAASLRESSDKRASELTGELAAARTDATVVRQERDDLEQALTSEQAALHAEQIETASLRGARDKLTEDVAAGRVQAQGLQKERELLTRKQQDLAASLAQETSQKKSLAEAKAGLEQQRADLVALAARLRAEIERLGKTREFRTGNFLWNKLPLGYVSRRGKKWYRRLLDAKSRCGMWAAGLFGRRRRADGVAVVAACWHWPIYSHTFVYQEMLGLTHMGLDVQMFHWEIGDTAQLHKAFSYLADHRTQLQPVWENHLRDKEHFEKTRPGRLRAFLERVAAVTGRKVDDLEKESIVVQGCTFARMAELAGARYLHSYFFYDQSFMAMQAAWLLDLPRGVSCYADHMLDDYPWKLVPLHVELASVIVATSARIKRELSEKTGGKYDDKIIVKPNGVDGARFPVIERADRKQGEPFEVISISRLEPKKGLTHLVEAVAELKKRGHRVIAHVVGSKDEHSKGSLEYAAEFEHRITELGLTDQIVLHGMVKQENLGPILQRCRAFVAPYVEMGSGDKDGIPTAMLEGLASGLPVVTTDSGSILEVIDTEVEGLIVAQRDSHAFAQALGRLIEDPALERRMAKAARARFNRDFDINVTERRLHERVARLVSAKQKGAAKNGAH